MHWMQIAIRPAKPFAFGVLDGTPVFGLPGNPVSSLVSFELFARPALRRMARPRPTSDRPRCGRWPRPTTPAPADGKIHFVRVPVDGADGDTTCAAGGASHQLAATAGATAGRPPDGDGVAPGDDRRPSS